ncbi:flavin monoamine oxidase family protein [Mucilaginibacter sp. E4BP6]|uniref:flavin monoamine oxidase family protein n=1 Tax=Mucilaginibacter sp. E4BP6 TaxID=2723089 RepID=UPI0015CC3D11|nr:NAD(P)/FAD-dependent oxidoreductase [Mucilaginibacter sp. E4BP6]NYE65150.1 monoamine oxidase [Mucilaginibacter sp. E4BP6]
MQTTDVLIIGAGAAGLMAAYRLSESGKKVIVLEARNRTGGRIHTISHESFFKHAELGAEFIHGNLPVTLNLLKEANIKYSAASGEMVRYDKGKFINHEGFIENWDLLLKKLNELEQDTDIANFLQTHFPGEEYIGLRDGVSKYVAGYDTADPNKASAFALRNEWNNEDDNAQHRLDDGYCSMITYLANKCKENGGSVYLNSAVTQIDWKQALVKVTIVTGEVYTAEKVIIALPLGVLQADRNEKGAIEFHPPIKEQSQAINNLGFGAIIKFLLEFKDAFWENNDTKKLAGKSLKDMAFLISDENIPTWWTQYPKHSTLLTGWLAGPRAKEKISNTNDELLQQALQSLSNLFKLSVDDLRAKLIASSIMNWTAEPFTRGSYSYDTVAAPEARKVLDGGVENTLFFAGEYLYEGPAMGTVEAALTSGQNVAKGILNNQ